MSDFAPENLGKVALDVMANYIIAGANYIGGKLAVAEKGVLFRWPKSPLFALDAAAAQTNPIIAKNLAASGDAQIFVAYDDFAEVKKSRQMGVSPAVTIATNGGKEYKFVTFSRKKVLASIAKYWKGAK